MSRELKACHCEKSCGTFVPGKKQKEYLMAKVFNRQLAALALAASQQERQSVIARMFDALGDDFHQIAKQFPAGINGAAVP